jgi:hypothetical protein
MKRLDGKNCIAVVLVWSFAFCAESVAETPVSGPITGTVYWTPAGSPYRLIGDVIIESGATLIIQSGVDVNTDHPTYNINTAGILVAGDDVDFLGSFLITITDGGSINLSDCNVTGFLDFKDGGEGTFTGGTTRYVILRGAGARTISNNTITDYLHFVSVGDTPAAVAGNTFESSVPFIIDDPDVDTSGITGNTYTGVDPYVKLRGTLNNSRAWGCIDGLCHHVLYGDLTIANGATLTVDAAVEMDTEHSTYDIGVAGILEADNVTFSGSFLITIADGGSIDLSFCNVTGYLDFKDGGGGTFTHGTTRYVILRGAGARTISNNNTIADYIRFDSVGDTPATVTGNTFEASVPFYINDPDVDTSGISGNTYTGVDPYVKLYGTLNNDRVWGCIDGLCHHVLYGDLTIANGATLTVDSAVEMDTEHPTYNINAAGVLVADNVTFSGSFLINISDGGSIDLSGCDVTGFLDFKDGGEGTFTGGATGYVILQGAGARTISNNNTITDYLHFVSVGDTPAAVAGNTFESSVPFIIDDPDVDTSGITGNTYTGVDPYVKLRGTLNNSRAWGCIDGLCHHVLYGDLTIANGATLTVDAAVEMDTEHSTYDIGVAGILEADNVTFSGSFLITITDGGSINLSGCNVTGFLDFKDGGAGTFTGGTTRYVILRGTGTRKFFGNTMEYVHFVNETSPICMADNTLTGSVPFYIDDPDADTSGICANTYEAVDPLIKFRGMLDNDLVWGCLDGLCHYVLYGDLTIANGATLRMDSAVDVDTEHSSYEIQVYGSLLSNGAWFLNNLWVRVKNGGSADLWNCGISHIDCAEGASGGLVYCVIDYLGIDSESSFTIRENNFAFGSPTTEVVIARGDSEATIDMENNWWGTNIALEVEDKIRHHHDDSGLPWVDYEPYLSEEPPDPTGGEGDFEPDGDVDMEDLGYFLEHWLAASCRCTNWCGGADLDQNDRVDLYDYARLAQNWLAGVE